MNSHKKVLPFLTGEESNSFYSRVTEFMIGNVHILDSLSITDVADGCFVSPATITRYAKKIGFSGYPEFRQTIIKTYNPMLFNMAFRMNNTDKVQLTENKEKYFRNYGNEIIRSIDDVVNNLNLGEIDSLIEKIFQAKHVCLFGYDSMESPIRVLQSGLLHSEKVTFVAENMESQINLAKTLKSDSLAIIITSFGTYLSDYFDTTEKICNSGCNSILISEKIGQLQTGLFKNVINITEESYVKIGSFPMDYVIDYIVRRYNVLLTKLKAAR